MDHNDTVRQFRDLTGATEGQAREYLEDHEWNLESAAQDYFASLDEVQAEPAAGQSSSQPEPEYTGPRTLDGRPAPPSSSSAAAASKAKSAQQKKKGVATLGSLSSSAAHDDGHDDEDMESDEDDRGPLFAGGEKSGLAVQDPKNQAHSGKKIVKDLLSQAKSNMPRPETEAGPSAPSRSNTAFRGTGMTLGGDGVESRAIPDPRGPPAPRQQRPEQTQEFVLHLWEDGFSIDDGELKRYDDPANQLALNMIKAGRAPIHLMNVNYDAPVDVKLEQHNEKWKQLPKKYKPFGGEGRRLGSPVPGDGNTASQSSTQAAAAAVVPPPTSAPMSTTEFQVDTAQPTLQLRIQMPDGSRLPARFNTTHTVGDVYQFVSRSSADVSTKPWVLATTFPNKDHTDKSLVLGDMPEFRRGGAAVVKWV